MLPDICRTPNSVLLTNTSIVEASRLLAAGEAEPRSSAYGSSTSVAVRRLIEFSTVAEAVVLNDQIFTVASEKPDDTDNLALLETLTEMGICRAIEPGDVTISAGKAVHELLGDLGNNAVYSFAVPNAATFLEIPWNRSVSNLSPVYDLREQLTLVFDDNFRQQYTDHYSEPDEDSDCPFIQTLQRHLRREVSPSTDYVAQQIRGTFYWTLAEQQQLHFSPDSIRAEWLGQWVQRVKASLVIGDN